MRREMAIINGGVIDVDDGEDNDVDNDDAGGDKVLSHQELIELCRKVEAGCTHYGGDPQFSVNLSRKLIQYRALLNREDMLTAKQTTLTFCKH